MNRLRIARGFALPADVAGEAIAILAKRGAGKTNTGRVLVEELHDANVQTVVLDPVGAWWGLRSSADGRSDGLPMPILGGAHGDVPLQAAAGALLADVVVDTGQSLVLDLSDFSKTEQRRFVTDFAERLYQRKARDRTLLHLVLEEADEFAPQRVSAGDARMVGAIEQLVRRGRGRGLGITVITQRSASLNKSVLEQTDVLLAMRTTGPRDRAAIEVWVAKQDVEGADQVLPSLSGLETGETWVWNPERSLLERVKVRLARTFDSASTPKAGERRTEPRKLAPIDLTTLGAEIEATAERAKENDPTQLRKQLRELRARVEKADEHTARLEQRLAERPPAETIVEQVEVPVFDGEVDRLEEAVRALVDVGKQLHQAGTAVAEASTRIASAVEGAREASMRASAAGAGGTERASSSTDSMARPPAARAQPEAVRRPPARPPAPAVDVDGGSVTGAAAAVLAALAQFPEGRTRKQLAGLTGYRATGSTMRGALADLRRRGYCSPAGVEPITATPEGIAAAGDVEPVPTGAELYAYWQNKLGGATRAVLDLLYAIGPDEGYTRDEIAGHTGYEPGGSTLRGALAELRKYDLATPAGVDPIRASATLYEEGT